MMFSVPQFIDVEDKIAGPLTWRQLGWMIAMGAVLLILFAIFETMFAIIVSIPIVLLFVALAFYKPNGIPMAIFIMHATMFLFRPKIAVWERPIKKYVPEKKEPEKPKENENAGDKLLTNDRIRELAKLIDSENRN